MEKKPSIMIALYYKFDKFILPITDVLSLQWLLCKHC